MCHIFFSLSLFNLFLWLLLTATCQPDILRQKFRKKRKKTGEKKLFRASPQAIHCNILAANRQFEKFKFFSFNENIYTSWRRQGEREPVWSFRFLFFLMIERALTFAQQREKCLFFLAYGPTALTKPTWARFRASGFATQQVKKGKINED